MEKVILKWVQRHQQKNYCHSVLLKYSVYHCWSINPCCAEFSLGKVTKYIFISFHWNGPGHWETKAHPWGSEMGCLCECKFRYTFCPPLWKRRIHLPCIVNGARASAAILLIVLSSNIPVPTLGGLAYAVVLKSCIFRTLSIILMDILWGTSQLTATWHQSTVTITALLYPSIIWWNFVGMCWQWSWYSPGSWLV